MVRSAACLCCVAASVCLLRLRSLGLDLAAGSSKLARERRGTRLCLVERAALLLGARRHRLARRAGLLGEGGGLLLLLLQGFSQFRDGGLRRLLLLRGLIDRLLRLRGLGLDLAARSRKLARECRGTRLCLVERAALLLGACRHRLARASTSWVRAAVFFCSCCRDSRNSAMAVSAVCLLLRGRIVRLLRLRGLGLDLAACSRKLARECRGTRLCLVECAALLLGACRHRLARSVDLLGEGGSFLLLLLQGFSQFRDGGLRRLFLLRGRIVRLLRLRGLGLDLAARSRKLARERRGTRLCLVERAALLLGACRHRLARRARPPG